jgi:hypothetical protein
VAVPIRADDGATSWRWQHGQDKADPVGPRMPSTVARGVELLRRIGAIGNAEETAAERFVTDYLLGPEGVRVPSGAERSGSADAHDVAIARAMAMGRHRMIAERCGVEVTAWLVNFLVNELSFTAMADLYWPTEEGRKQMQGAMMFTLKYLSMRYAELDQGRPPRL